MKAGVKRIAHPSAVRFPNGFHQWVKATLWHVNIHADTIWSSIVFVVRDADAAPVAHMCGTRAHFDVRQNRQTHEYQST